MCSAVVRGIIFLVLWPRELFLHEEPYQATTESFSHLYQLLAILGGNTGLEY